MRSFIIRTLIAFIFILSCFLAMGIVYDVYIKTNGLNQNDGRTDSAATYPARMLVEMQDGRRGSTSISCENKNFQEQFLTLLNSYRKQNSKSLLLLDESLTLAACDHSRWLKENEAGNDSGVRLSHAGVNNSTPVERCKARGTYCAGENIALSKPNNTPQTVLTLYQNSPMHNANLLGEYSRVGIAWSGFYQVTEFQ